MFLTVFLKKLRFFHTGKTVGKHPMKMHSIFTDFSRLDTRECCNFAKKNSWGGVSNKMGYCPIVGGITTLKEG